MHPTIAVDEFEDECTDLHTIWTLDECQHE